MSPVRSDGGPWDRAAVPLALPRYDVNCSLVFAELPLLQRPQAARDAGFAAVEFQWPFDTALPGDAEVDAFAQAVREAGVALVSLNASAGGPGERGLASLPGREAEFRDNLAVAVGIAGELGCPHLHVLYGRRGEASAEEADELGAEHLALAADSAADVAADVLVEALSGVPDYPLRTAADVVRVLDRVGRPDVRWLCDLYHLSVNGDDVAAAVQAHADRIGHVQIADAPGRHQPGTGSLDLAGLLRLVLDTGYDGWVGLEHSPLGPSAASLERLPLLD